MIYQRFLDVADKKQEVFDEDLIAIVNDEIHTVEEKYKLDYLHSVIGRNTSPSATVWMIVNQKSIQGSASGDGPVDAVFKAINSMVGDSYNFIEYNINSASGGADAMGNVTVRLQKDRPHSNCAKMGGVTVIGRGASTDIVEASAKAYINGINQICSYYEDNQCI